MDLFITAATDMLVFAAFCFLFWPCFVREELNYILLPFCFRDSYLLPQITPDPVIIYTKCNGGTLECCAWADGKNTFLGQNFNRRIINQLECHAIKEPAMKFLTFGKFLIKQPLIQFQATEALLSFHCYAGQLHGSQGQRLIELAFFLYFHSQRKFRRI